MKKQVKKEIKKTNGNGKEKPQEKLILKVRLNLWKMIIGGLIFLLFAPLFLSFFSTQGFGAKVTTSQALNDVKENKVNEVKVQGDKLILVYKDKSVKVATLDSKDSFSDLLEKQKIDPSTVNYTVVDQSMAKVLAEMVGILLPVLLIGGIFFYVMKAQNRMTGDMFSFGKSKAKLFAKGKQNVKFADVAGVDEAKRELEEIVDFLKNPKKYQDIGARTPKGVLLFGPAGVGKTLLAKAVAGEAGVPFFSMAGSEFMEMLVGVGASRVRDLFATAKVSNPSIIFIDEIDAIGRQRGRGLMGGHDEREQTLNQILVEMDGFTPNDNVIVLAATNRGDLLDPALLRPGRFDRRIMLDMPDREGRTAILKIHARNKKFKENIIWEKVSDKTVGFSGADLENMLNEAAILAARNGKTQIEMEDILESATKVKLGPARKKAQSEEDKKITAYHEAGHAVVTYFTPKMDPVERISIVARGMSLGHTLIPAALDRTHDTRTQMLGRISAMLGGRAAEKVIFNEMTSGASSDIEGATRIARAMVVDYGMSDLGPTNLGAQYDFDEMGKANFYEPTQISPIMQEKVDNEVKKIIDEAYKKAVAIVKSKKKTLDKIVKVLIEKETIDRTEFEELVK